MLMGEKGTGGAVSDLFCSVSAWVVAALPVSHHKTSLWWFLTFMLVFGPLAGARTPTPTAVLL